MNDYEKKYKEAIERLKQWDMEHPNGYIIRERDEFIFPELAESEDERIRNCIRCLTSLDQAQDVIADMGFTRQDLLAYLEKQKEQKPIMGNGISEQTKMNETVYKFTSEEWKKALDEQLPKEQKPAEWSEEDERIRNQLISDVEHPKKEGLISAKQNKATKALYDGIEKCYDEKIAWLKSLHPQSKQSIAAVDAEQLLKILPSPQPKQEWNTHDKAIVNCIVCCLDGQFVPEAARKQALAWFNKHRRDFLNSPFWKPSKEQMKYLQEAISEAKRKHDISTDGYYGYIVLVSLREDLKKL